MTIEHEAWPYNVVFWNSRTPLWNAIIWAILLNQQCGLKKTTFKAERIDCTSEHSTLVQVLSLYVAIATFSLWKPAPAHYIVASLPHNLFYSHQTVLVSQSGDETKCKKDTGLWHEVDPLEAGS